MGPKPQQELVVGPGVGGADGLELGGGSSGNWLPVTWNLWCPPGRAAPRIGNRASEAPAHNRLTR